MTSFNPIRRKPIRPKAKQAKQSMPWRATKIRLDAEGMKELRAYVLKRSGGQCENSYVRPGEEFPLRCDARISWYSFNLAHIFPRGRGGSDIPENTLAACWDCHDLDTTHKRKLQPYEGWQARPETAA